MFILFLDSQPVSGLAVFSSEIFLDNVQCIGNEGTLLNCSRNEIGDHNCGSNSGAGVRCKGTHLFN